MKRQRFGVMRPPHVVSSNAHDRLVYSVGIVSKGSLYNVKYETLSLTTNHIFGLASSSISHNNGDSYLHHVYLVARYHDAHHDASHGIHVNGGTFLP
jgi:hypothetical protein